MGGGDEYEEEMICTARDELSVRKIFAPEFWTPDGNWSYDVHANDGQDVLFSDVAMAHPLIMKWTSVVEDSIRQWQIDRSILDDDSLARMDTSSTPQVSSSAFVETKKPLDW